MPIFRRAKLQTRAATDTEVADILAGLPPPSARLAPFFDSCIGVGGVTPESSSGHDENHAKAPATSSIDDITVVRKDAEPCDDASPSIDREASGKEVIDISSDEVLGDETDELETTTRTAAAAKSSRPMTSQFTPSLWSFMVSAWEKDGEYFSIRRHGTSSGNTVWLDANDGKKGCGCGENHEAEIIALKRPEAPPEETRTVAVHYKGCHTGGEAVMKCEWLTLEDTITMFVAWPR